MRATSAFYRVASVSSMSTSDLRTPPDINQIDTGHIMYELHINIYGTHKYWKSRSLPYKKEMNTKTLLSIVSDGKF